jgi:hypothetical protein
MHRERHAGDDAEGTVARADTRNEGRTGTHLDDRPMLAVMIMTESSTHAVPVQRQ